MSAGKEFKQRPDGRQNATTPPGPGAPPCGRERLTATDKQRADIENLAAAGWGRRAIANKMQLSERSTPPVQRLDR